MIYPILLDMTGRLQPTQQIPNGFIAVKSRVLVSYLLPKENPRSGTRANGQRALRKLTPRFSNGAESGVRCGRSEGKVGRSQGWQQEAFSFLLLMSSRL